MKNNLSPKENFLEAIRFGKPEYIPRGDENFIHHVGLDNFRMETWTDAFGVRWVSEMQGTVPFPKDNPIKNIEEWESLRFPNPDDLFCGAADKREQIKAAKDEGKLIIGGFTYFLFERVWALTGMENFLIGMAEAPDAVRGLLHRTAGYAKRVFDNYMELGADGVSFSEDLGTQRATIFSPAHFDDFFVPEYRYIFENLLNAGKIINFHSCGCIESIADRLADLRITILNPVQARANDLTGLKRKTQNKFALEGAVDSHLLLTGTPDDVRAETARVIEIMKPGGGYICRPDQGFPNYPPENIAAIYKTAAELGRY